ncbi:flagellar hook-basal body complex protein FliE [Egibacter rhizosphaerae]|uniref:flagellar hook-basal body complex protein FliE n=1 Tax=Egibacter rhizosphaerae TaxID=1670831 RepID=UPI0013F179B9|nr:flagellar hook-basal body complex protein FliE [Egibacter rhizosphaerae]
MSAIPPIPPPGEATGVTAAAAAQQPDAPAGVGNDFADMFQQGLEEVSALEQGADAVATDIATGGDSQIHDLMIATSKSEIGTELLVQTRNKALEAYHEIMQLPV